MLARLGSAAPIPTDAAPAHPNVTTKPPLLRLPALDGLRAVAAMYVVVFHSVLGFYEKDLVGPWRVLKRACVYGHEAVAVFIVLSGFCLMLPVVRRDSRGLGVDFSRFVRRRARRILPPYYAALGLSLALLALVTGLQQRTQTTWDDSLPGLAVAPIAAHLLVVHNWVPSLAMQINGPLWSVATEWQIYFFFPLVLLPIWRRFGPGVALLAAAGLGYAPLLLWPGPAAKAAPWYLLLFGCGMLAAAISFSHEPRFTSLRGRRFWKPLSGGLWLSCLLLSNGAAWLWFGLKPLSDVLVGLATAALLVHLTACVTEARPSRVLSVLESRPLQTVGSFSYSLYLTHLPIVALGYLALRHSGLAGPQQALLLLVLGLLASLAVARAFFGLVERRFLLDR